MKNQKVVSRLRGPLLGLVAVMGVGAGIGRVVYAKTAAVKAPKSKALTKFVQPRNPQGDAKFLAEFKAHIAKKGPLAAPPVVKTRGLQPNQFTGSQDYWGMSTFNYYTNDGAPDYKGWFGETKKGTDNSCGQAAAATIMRHWKVIADDSGDSPVRDLYLKFPPDGYLGMAGTSWQRMRSMLQSKGMQTSFISGESELRDSIIAGKPVIVMLDVGKFPEWGMPGGHWVVVHGFTRGRYYLSNWKGRDYATRDNFLAGWIDNIIVNGGGFSGRGLVGTSNRGHF